MKKIYIRLFRMTSRKIWSCYNNKLIPFLWLHWAGIAFFARDIITHLLQLLFMSLYMWCISVYNLELATSFNWILCKCFGILKTIGILFRIPSVGDGVGFNLLNPTMIVFSWPFHILTTSAHLLKLQWWEAHIFLNVDFAIEVNIYLSAHRQHHWKTTLD